MVGLPPWWLEAYYNTLGQVSVLNPRLEPHLQAETDPRWSSGQKILFPRTNSFLRLILLLPPPPSTRLFLYSFVVAPALPAPPPLLSVFAHLFVIHLRSPSTIFFPFSTYSLAYKAADLLYFKCNEMFKLSDCLSPSKYWVISDLSFEWYDHEFRSCCKLLKLNKNCLVKMLFEVWRTLWLH